MALLYISLLNLPYMHYLHGHLLVLSSGEGRIERIYSEYILVAALLHNKHPTHREGAAVSTTCNVSTTYWIICLL